MQCRLPINQSGASLPAPHTNPFPRCMQIRSIVDLMLAEVKARCHSQRRLHLEVTEATISKICDEGYDRSYGARPLRRKVTSLVEDALSEFILVGAYHENDTLLVDVNKAGEVVVIHRAQPDPCDYKVSRSSVRFLLEGVLRVCSIPGLWFCSALKPRLLRECLCVICCLRGV
jgi:hypothetical protein